VTYVRFGSKADMCGARPDVRFAPKSGHHGGLPDIKNGSGDAGRYSRSFGMSASVASPLYGEGNAYCVTAAIARNSRNRINLYFAIEATGSQ
jgi:hypothetical protein